MPHSAWKSPPGNKGIDECLKVSLPDKASDLDNDSNTNEKVDLYYHHNSLGSVVAVTNAVGGVVESYRYSAFGKPTIYDEGGSVIASTYVEQPFMFTGARCDFEEGSGLYHMRHRYYDPVVGRFVSRDPLGLWGDPSQNGNGQGYCGHNPVNFVDRLGLDVWIEGSGVKEDGENEPGPHISISVGDPNGEYTSFSYGVDGNDVMTADYGLTGQVYIDDSSPGDILDDHYYDTDRETDLAIIRALMKLVGLKGKYRFLNMTCRDWSFIQFALIEQELKRVGRGTKTAPPPITKPKRGRKARGSGSVASTTNETSSTVENSASKTTTSTTALRIEASSDTSTSSNQGTPQTPPATPPPATPAPAPAPTPPPAPTPTGPGTLPPGLPNGR